MKNILNIFAASAAIITTVSAHSWLECTNHDNTEILGWMKGNSTLNPPVIIDPAMPWYAYLCKGWPRNKANPGNWIEESSFYTWNINDKKFVGDTHACHPSQRSPTYQNNAPMASAAPGDMIRLRYGGNGHTRGDNVPGGVPGTVSVFWKGAPEQEITDISEFTPKNTLQTAAFDGLAFAYPANKNIKTPVQGLVDKGNWMELNIPKDMAPGRHMMVWVWYTDNAPKWSTCFDVMVSGSAKSPTSPAPAAAYSAPAAPANVVVPAPVAAAPAASSPAAAAAAAAPVNAVAPPQVNDAPAPSSPPSPSKAAEFQTTTTVTEWFTEWTTTYVEATGAPYNKAKRSPREKRNARAFSS